MVKLFRSRAEPVASLHGQVDAGLRVYAIGDIHGRADLLYRMIERIVEDAEQFSDGRIPHLVFLGDYIDFGPDARVVIAALMMIEDEMLFEGVEFLQGRHEAMLLNFLADPEMNTGWLRAGGAATMESYRVAPPTQKPSADTLMSVADAMRDCLGDHLEFLNNTKLTYRSGDVVFAHAGIDPFLPWDAQTDEAVHWSAPDTLTRQALRGMRVVHGQFDSAQPLILPHRICVDTGAYYSDRLTAVRLDGDTEILTVSL